MIRTADVVIVGGGVTGCSIAFHLAEQGVGSIVILERRFLASGGTGRSVGIMRQLYPTPETSRMVLHSLRVFQNFREVTGGEAGYVQCGAIIAVAPAQRDALAKTLIAQRELGIQARLLSPDDIRELDPRIDPFAVGAAVYEPESGYGDPTGVTAGFAQGARRRGVVIDQMAEVTAIRTAGDRVSGVRTAAGDTIEAPVVVNAAGLWCQHVAEMAGVTLPIVIGRHPVFIIERTAAFGRPHPVYLDLASGTFLRPETGGLTLTGFLDADEPNHPMDPEALGADVPFDEVAAIMERASRCVPALGDARYQRGYAGAFDISPDWMPILDETPVRGFYVAVGMSGHGFKLSPAIGRLMADLITTGRSSLTDLGAFRLDRFAARPHEDVGAFSHSYLR
ncbi:MAG TPA: FAD-dependent oxidoreductase [Methylomirabilota bacterium]|jgi:glycine/D-amino acid oxidase-like deaminating enzyme|nr:FAD-dependent oxidoreductase [Methylomirabilota bacterium]